MGPLTNLAAVLAGDPSLVAHVSSLTIMGGNLRRIAYAGHVFPPGVDDNLCSDPEAIDGLDGLAEALEDSVGELEAAV